MEDTLFKSLLNSKLVLFSTLFPIYIIYKYSNDNEYNFINILIEYI